MSLLNVYRKEIDRQTKEVLFQNKLIVGMAVVIGILIFMSFTYVDKLAELSETNKQLNTQIKQLEYKNNTLQADYRQSKRLLNDTRVKLLTSYNNAVNEVIGEIRDTYYIEGIKLTQKEQQYIHKVADEYDVDYILTIGLIDLESNFDKDAIGKNKKSEDYSLFQVNSLNEGWIEQQLGRELNLMHFYDNVDAGIWILSHYRDGNIYKWLTAYNKGFGGLQEYYKNHLTYKSDYAKMVLDRKSKYE